MLSNGPINDTDIEIVEEHVLVDLDSLSADFVQSLAGRAHRIEVDEESLRLLVGSAVFQALRNPQLPRTDTTLVFEMGGKVDPASAVLVDKKVSATLQMGKD